jgi:hypothetical protein
MAAEIILDPERSHEEQMQEILALVEDGSGDEAHVHWYPRPDKPHGGVVAVPEHIAEAHASQSSSDDEAASGDEHATPRRRGRPRRASPPTPAEALAPVSGDAGAGSGGGSA